MKGDQDKSNDSNILHGFESQENIEVSSRGVTFRTYLAGAKHLFGSGLVLCIHGAGFTGLTWSLMAELLSGGGACVLAPDLRGHGATTTADPAASTDLSTETLLADLVALIETFTLQRLEEEKAISTTPQTEDTGLLQSGLDSIESSVAEEVAHGLTEEVLSDSLLSLIEDSPGAMSCGKSKCLASSGTGLLKDDRRTCQESLPIAPAQPREPPRPPSQEEAKAKRKIKICLVGHSLGGTLVVRLAAQKDRLFSALNGVELEVTGLVVIDVVEGTALASLDHMSEVLSRIPKSFKSTEAGITWAVRSKSIRNRRSAEASFPSRLKQSEDGTVTWITNIELATSYWRGWFEGLSDLFLSLELPKMLIVAGMDRLDTTLIVGQHQGRYQLKLVYAAGHAIHEDQPEEVSESISDFINRFGVFFESIQISQTSKKEQLEEKLRKARQMRKEQRKNNIEKNVAAGGN